MKKRGFAHFVGVDGSKTMLEEALKTGLYQDLKQCILGEQLIPVERGSVILSKRFSLFVIYYQQIK